MPTYEYRCPQCSKTFTQMTTIKEHEKGTKCPICGTPKVEPILSTFIAKTSRKT